MRNGRDLYHNLDTYELLAQRPSYLIRREERGNSMQEEKKAY